LFCEYEINLRKKTMDSYLLLSEFKNKRQLNKSKKYLSFGQFSSLIF